MRRRDIALLTIAGVIVAGAVVACVVPPGTSEPTIQPSAHLPGAGVQGRIQSFCSACHAYPEPDSLPKSAWKAEVQRGFRFFAESGMTRAAPPIEEVIAYFEQQAPDELPPAV